MKRTVIAFLLGAALATAGSAYAEDIAMIGKKVEGEFAVKVNGKKLDKKALVVDDTSYLPVRAIGEALNMDIKFDADLGVELTAKEDNTTMTTAVTAEMSVEDAEAIKTSEEQILKSENQVVELTAKIKSLEEDLSKNQTELSQATTPEQKQWVEGQISSVKASIEGVNFSLQAAKDNINAQQAYIEKIKAKYTTPTP